MSNNNKQITTEVFPGMNLSSDIAEMIDLYLQDKIDIKAIKLYHRQDKLLKVMMEAWYQNTGLTEHVDTYVCRYYEAGSKTERITLEVSETFDGTTEWLKEEGVDYRDIYRRVEVRYRLPYNIHRLHIVLNIEGDSDLNFTEEDREEGGLFFVLEHLDDKGTITTDYIRIEEDDYADNGIKRLMQIKH